VTDAVNGRLKFIKLCPEDTKVIQKYSYKSLRVLFRAFSVIFAINLPTYAQYFHHFIIYLQSPTCFGTLWTIIRAL
jgi:hypothetical protein